METKLLDELNANPDNPRIISKHDFEALKRSIKRFGDLSGIVFNVRTKQLVGGHQRIKAMQAADGAKSVQILERFNPMLKDGTIAVGRVIVDGQGFSYREVDWDEPTEQAANIAANRISGEFDTNLLAEMTYKIQQAMPDMVEYTGQTQKEIDKLMESIGVKDTEPEQDNSADDDAEKNELVFSVTPEQSELIAKALEHARITKDIPAQDHKAKNGAALYYIAEAYLANVPNPDIAGEFTPPELPEL